MNYLGLYATVEGTTSKQIKAHQEMTEIEKMIAAANANNGEAQYDLAVAYMNGDGVPQNYAEAYFWLNVCYFCGGMFWTPSPPELAAKIILEIFGDESLGEAITRADLWIKKHGVPVTGDY